MGLRVRAGGGVPDPGEMGQKEDPLDFLGPPLYCWAMRIQHNWKPTTDHIHDVTLRAERHFEVIGIIRIGTVFTNMGYSMSLNRREPCEDGKLLYRCVDSWAGGVDSTDPDEG